MPSNEVGPSHQELLRIIHVSLSARRQRLEECKGSGSAPHEDSSVGRRYSTVGASLSAELEITMRKWHAK